MPSRYAYRYYGRTAETWLNQQRFSFLCENSSVPLTAGTLTALSVLTALTVLAELTVLTALIYCLH